MGIESALVRSRLRAARAGVGALAGALAALLSEVLGLWSVGGAEPAYLVAASLAAGAVLGTWGANRLLFAVDAALLCGYLVVAFTPIASRWSARWVRRDPRPAWVPEAIVVLSSTVLPDSGLDGAGTERLLSAIELWRAGVAPRLLTTRVVAEDARRRLTSDADQARLLQLGGARTSWAVLDSVASTRDEALRSLHVLGKGRRIVLVTSPMHSRRACRVFESVGFQVYCVPARERSRATVNVHSPSDRLFAFREYLYERVAVTCYGWRGWI